MNSVVQTKYSMISESAHASHPASVIVSPRYLPAKTEVMSALRSPAGFAGTARAGNGVVDRVW
ncbi:MAG: hypothetical protein JWO38_2587 [Gemmataceae bacterium]|nr:hypothetical protein [Gemmataceae bacterium]